MNKRNSASLIDSIIVYKYMGCYEKYIYSYDENGNVLTVLLEEWDKGELENYKKDTYTYDAQGNMIEELNEEWADDIKVLKGMSKHNYDSDGKIIYSSHAYWTGMDLRWGRRTTYIYDMEKNLIMQLTEGNLDEYLDENSWENNYRDVYSFDHEGRETSSSHEFWDDNVWIASYKDTTTYDSNGNKTKIFSNEWDRNLNRFEKQVVSKYDSSGKIMFWRRKHVVLDATHTNYQGIYFYDGSGKLTLWLIEAWNGQEWVNSQRFIFTYDSNNNVSSVLLEGLDERDNWQNEKREIYTYNIFGNRTRWVRQNWEDNIWVNDYRETTEIDVNGNLISFLSEKVIDGVWETATSSNLIQFVPLRLFTADIPNSEGIYLHTHTGYIHFSDSYGSEYCFYGKEMKVYYNSVTAITSNKEIVINYSLSQNYPNPFNPSTTISYFLPSTSNVKLEIYDVMGRMIKSFTANSQSSGTHQVVWDGTNTNGSRVSTGIYIYKFEAASIETNEHFAKSEKLMLVK